MSGETAAVVRSRVYATVQLRHTQRGTPAARFTVMQVPREFDRARGRWHDREPVPVICTVIGPPCPPRRRMPHRRRARDRHRGPGPARPHAPSRLHPGRRGPPPPRRLHRRRPARRARRTRPRYGRMRGSHAPPGHRAGPSRSSPAQAAVPGTDWWQTKPRTSWNAPTAGRIPRHHRPSRHRHARRPQPRHAEVRRAQLSPATTRRARLPLHARPTRWRPVAILRPGGLGAARAQ